MAEHLTPDQLTRYAKRELPPAELITADEHVSSCEPCRQRVSDPQWLEATFAFLRHHLETQAKIESHIDYEHLEAYVDNSGDEADREIVESHVELCQMCREELRDLQEFRDSTEPGVSASHFSREQHLHQEDFSPSLGSFSHQASVEPLTVHSSPSGQDDTAFTRKTGPTDGLWERVSHFWRYPGYLAGVASAVAIVLVAVLFVPHRHSASKQPNASVPSRTSSPGQTLPAVPESQQELQTPAELASLIGKTATLLGSGTHGASFRLEMPVGTFAEDVQPTFRWQALAGATSYKVTVFDEALGQVAASPALSTTDWKISARLERGKVYLWQVAATKNGEQVVAPAPPAPEAKFEVLELSQANALEQLKRDHPDAHFALGSAYAKAGVLDEAEREFRLVSGSDVNYALAQKFIHDVEALRHSGR